MPLHIQMPCTDDSCGGSCNACTLGWCKVCGAGESELTTHCPGPLPRATEEERLELGRKRDGVSYGVLDFTEERGWHDPQGKTTANPRFAK